MSNPAPPPTAETSLREYPYVVIRFRCTVCERAADVRLAVLAARFGPNATLGRLVSMFVGGCWWSPHNPARKPQKYGMKCGGHCPDLFRPGPPDLPPSMTGLTLIEGGKGDMLPAEPKPVERRRRVGDADV
ncbi:MAG TPA: hypothetical protein VGN82_14090 [Bosea sp. (in: a-proteobacteria)]|jgi:hypothetical protein|uniref:hypothetical protein n=1 Tax=Bosea sp. (in: a-proteobacteria) TaxID=1871050 RepID=UPI002E0E15BF|nr:hypothetical protein [Bosea sp. (in: a-proteobacteria)]